MRNTVEKLKALGEANRFRIMMMLRERPLCVCEIQCVLKISGSNLSNHLKILKYSGLLDSRREGKWIEYFIKDESVTSLLNNILKDIDDLSQIDSDIRKTREADRLTCSVSK